MNKEELIRLAANFVNGSEDNVITKEFALSESLVGMKLYEEPIFGFATTHDELFNTLQDQGVIGKHFKLPEEWLPQARTVISFFLPFTEEVRKSNRTDLAWPSEAWLHGRIEGQAFMKKFCKFISSELTTNGFTSLAPTLDERFFSRSRSKAPYNSVNHEEITIPFTSNWSERHVAFVCGLGTFGLSKGIITSKGMAGRLGSVITKLQLPTVKRNYKDVYEYCTMCGVCINNCPANAISIEDGKNHDLCGEFIDKTSEKYKPRFGCGKCQVGVPCEKRIP